MRLFKFSCEKQEGMSYIEIIMVVGILSIITSMALPSMSELMNNVAIRSERQALVQDIRITRYKAISRRRPAYLCALDEQGLCARQTHWNQGWMGFVDNNLNSVYDQGDEQVVRHSKLRKNRKVDIIFHARWTNIKFDGRGVLRRSGHFRVCNPDKTGEQKMQLIRMNTHGRLAIETGEFACE